MINQKRDLDMITRKIKVEIPTFHYDDLEVSEITTETSWMKLHVIVLFIKDDVQITKELYKDYETGLWYYIKSDGMIISHKDTFNHTIKNLIDEMIYDCHLEMEEVAKETSETEATTPRNTIETLPPQIYNDTDINPVCMKCQDENLLPYNCNDCNNGKLRKNSFYGMFGGYPSITEMYNDKCFCCLADRKGNECKGKKTCGKTWKRYEAITNPEWHHVSLATLANIDFNMLDKKRQVYLKAHRELKRTLADLSKCKTGHTYEARARKFMRDMISQYYDNEISYAMRKYLDLQLSMSNVVNGVWSSYVEPATGLHESRRYSRPTLTY